MIVFYSRAYLINLILLDFALSFPPLTPIVGAGLCARPLPSKCYTMARHRDLALQMIYEIRYSINN